MNKWWTGALLIILITTGCSTATRNGTSPSPQNNYNVKAQQTAPQKKEIKNPNEVALHLEQLAKGVKGVKNAHCVVFGNTAVVGIDIDGNMERSQVGIVKYTVAEAFHKDPYGIDALVTADIDISHRLQEMGTDIRNGRPIAGFAEEMADIIGRVIPQLPRHITPRDDQPIEERTPERSAQKNAVK